jgi:hypothetical protein
MRKMMKHESVSIVSRMPTLFKESRSPGGATRIPGLLVLRMTTRNTRCSFRATFMAFFIYLFVSGCTIRSDKTTIVTDDCEQTCRVISAAKKHALKRDQAFLVNNHFYSVTNTGNVWEVRFQAKAPPGMVLIGGGVTFIIDGKALSVTNTLYEQ